MGCEFDRASRGPLREEEQEEKDEKGSVVMVTYLYVWYKTLQGEVYYRRSTKGGGLGEEYYQGKKYILSYSESKKTLVSGVMAGWACPRKVVTWSPGCWRTGAYRISSPAGGRVARGSTTGMSLKSPLWRMQQQSSTKRVGRSP